MCELFYKCDVLRCVDKTFKIYGKLKQHITKQMREEEKNLAVHKCDCLNQFQKHKRLYSN